MIDKLLSSDSSGPSFNNDSPLAQAERWLDNELPEWEVLQIQNNSSQSTTSYDQTSEQASKRQDRSAVVPEHITITEAEVSKYLESFAQKGEELPDTELLEPPKVVNSEKVTALKTIIVENEQGLNFTITLYDMGGNKYIGFRSKSDNNVYLTIKVKSNKPERIFTLIYTATGLLNTFNYERNIRPVSQVFPILGVQGIRDAANMTILFGSGQYLEDDNRLMEYAKRWLYANVFTTGLNFGNNWLSNATDKALSFEWKHIKGSTMISNVMAGTLSLFFLQIDDELRDRELLGLYHPKRTPLTGRLTSWSDFVNLQLPRLLSIISATIVTSIPYQMKLTDPRVLKRPALFARIVVRHLQNPGKLLPLIKNTGSFTSFMILQILISALISDSPIPPTDDNAVTDNFMHAMNRIARTAGKIVEKYLLRFLNHAALTLEQQSSLNRFNSDRADELQKMLDDLHSTPIFTAKDLEEIEAIKLDAAKALKNSYYGDATSLAGNVAQIIINLHKTLGDLILANIFYFMGDVDRSNYHNAQAELSIEQTVHATETAYNLLQDNGLPTEFYDMVATLRKVPKGETIEHMLKQRLMQNPELITQLLDNLSQLQKIFGKTKTEEIIRGLMSAAYQQGLLHKAVERLSQLKNDSSGNDGWIVNILQKYLRYTLINTGDLSPIYLTDNGFATSSRHGHLIAGLSAHSIRHMDAGFSDLSDRENLIFDLLIHWSGVDKTSEDFTAEDFAALRDLILSPDTTARLAALGITKEDLLVGILAQQKSPNGQAGAIRALLNYASLEDIFNKANFTGDWLADAVRSSRVSEKERRELLAQLQDKKKVRHELPDSIIQITTPITFLSPLKDRVSNYEELVGALMQEWSGSNKNQLTHQDIVHLAQILSRKEVRELLEKYGKTPKYLLVSILARSKSGVLNTLLDKPDEIAYLEKAGYSNAEEWLENAIKYHVDVSDRIRTNLYKKLQTLFIVDRGLNAYQETVSIIDSIRTIPSKEQYGNTYESLVGGVLREWSRLDKNQFTIENIIHLKEIIASEAVQTVLKNNGKTSKDLLVSVLARSKPFILASLMDNLDAIEYLQKAGYPNAELWLKSAIDHHVHAKPNSAIRKRLYARLQALRQNLIVNAGVDALLDSQRILNHAPSVAVP